MLLLEKIGMSETSETLTPSMFWDQARAQEIEDYGHTRWFWGVCSQAVWSRLHCLLFLLADWLVFFEEFYGRQHPTKTNGGPIMPLTWDTSEKSANHWSKKINDGNQVRHPVWTVPVPSCAIRCIDGDCYLPGDCTSENEWLGAGRQNEVRLYEMRSPCNLSDSQSHSFLALQRLRNIEYSGELHEDYGSSYNFDTVMQEH